LQKSGSATVATNNKS